MFVQFKILFNLCLTKLFDTFSTMPKLDSDTKQKILVAAEKVFHANGFKGTRTTLIAEEAGISRTMLHYYYNRKEMLFQEVLNNTMGSVLMHVNRLIAEDKSLDELVGHLVDVIADVLEDKPGLPSFLVNLLNESPEMAQMMAANPDDTVPRQLDKLLNVAREKGEVSTLMTGEDLIMNIYALCSLPYLGASYIKAKENRNDEQMKTFIRQRRASIKDFVLKGLK
jgi:TetR/AcrR family transcriptional regulator